MLNIFKHIYQDYIYNKRTDENELNLLSQLLMNEFSNIIPESSNFHNYMKYELPSIDRMYEHDDVYSIQIMKEDKNFDLAEMHEEYNLLLVDAFNIYSNNKLLGQMTLLLICRYYSDTAEFIRNLDRMYLLFDENDLKLHQWVVKAIDKFVDSSEKANIWFAHVPSKSLPPLPAGSDFFATPLLKVF